MALASRHQDGAIVGEHPRCFGRGEMIYDPWHYVPVLARKPGALRNGAPFKDWPLPASLELVRRKLKGSDVFCMPIGVPIACRLTVFPR